MQCYLGLGSNVSDRVGMVARAVACLCSQGDIVLRKLSCMYGTKPWGYVGQEDFINAVAHIETHLSPHELLAKVKAIEGNLGRRDRFRWGPREIDIDILFYGRDIIKEDTLRIPHPFICQRGFVLAPLVEIAPDLVHPETGRKVSGHLQEVSKSGEATWQSLGI